MIAWAAGFSKGGSVRKLVRIALVATIAATVPLLAGCTTAAPSGVDAAPVSATVVNMTGRTIARINYQECGSAPDRWIALQIGPLPAGGRAQFPLPAACVNLVAIYEDGRPAGTQVGVRRDFPFQWTLS